MRTSVHNPRYTTRLSSVVTDAVVISHGDWKRVKHDSVHLTPEQHADIRARQDQARQQSLSQIQTKRSTLISPELTQQTTDRTHTVLSQTEDRVHALKMAERQADEDLDEVKLVRSQMVAAEARTVRDGQLRENAEIRETERRREREWADQLEQNRQDAAQMYDDREATLRDQRRRGRAIITAQIEEHKINAILEAERRDREAKALREQNEVIAEENRRIDAERKRRQRAFLSDCLADEAARREQRRRDRDLEKKEVEMVMEVAAQRSLSQAALEQERSDQKALKEREIAQIRKKQQRAIDGQAIRDEAMAIKVQKERDEIAREREERDRAKKSQMMEECRADREMMITAKKERLIQQEALENAQAEAVLAANREARDKARKERERKVQVDTTYRTELGQTAQREWDAKQVDPKRIQKDRQSVLESNEAYLAKIHRIRQEKLETLRRRGVPEKYLVDIQADRFELR